MWAAAALLAIVELLNVAKPHLREIEDRDFTIIVVVAIVTLAVVLITRKP